ncbi:MAG: phenylalanine--tRNA ligase subunit beta [Chloroflexi bacterium]|nr:MAG: phenylalanine--tRNA ligase subunit beta [Chloroflexota bacterium]
MKASLRWLRDYAALDATLEQMVRALVETGTEVGAAEHLGAGIVVARVTDLQPLPGSSQGLQLATVDIGTATRQVVSGAPNLRVGELVPYAPPGSRPPAMDEPIGVQTKRKVRSEGMLCSAAELGAGDDAGGILLLEKGTPGQPLNEVLDLDVVLDIDVTTNRPDCLCHVGIARELAAALPGETLHEPRVSVAGSLESAASAEGRAVVRIDDPYACPRFAVRLIEGLAVRPSPAWMQQRLRAIGLRPINNVVDVTNYVAHELGQPLHAFDLDRFVAAAGSDGRVADVVVRRATSGERLRCLDGEERALDPADVVVCAGETVASLAGVIGGADTAVDDSTRNVLLEAANWNGPTVRATSRRLGLRTDASTLFEKGLSDTLPPQALDRAAGLIAETAQGHVLRETIDEWPQPLPRLGPISVSAGFLSDRLGYAVDATEAATVLAHLGFAVEQDAGTLVVIPPSFRRDVAIAEDVVEEVGRMLGYARVPSTLPGRREPLRGVAPPAPVEESVRDACTGAGFDEAITLSFVSPRAAAALPGLGAGNAPMPLRNPLSEEWSVLRASQLPGLCEAVATNVNAGSVDVALFEVGRVFWEGKREAPVPGSTPDGADRDLPALPLEPLLLSVAVHSGDQSAGSGAAAVRRVQSLFDWLARDLAGRPLVAAPRSAAGLRAGRSAALELGGRAIGVVGEVERRMLDGFDIRGRLAVGELRLDAITPGAGRRIRFEAPAAYPAVVQDLAITVPIGASAGQALRVIAAAGAPLLEEAELYDEYRGERLAAARKGWTFRLTFRAPDRTLTGDDAQQAQEAIVAALQRECAAEVRA